jgi:hypothetical protein
MLAQAGRAQPNIIRSGPSQYINIIIKKSKNSIKNLFKNL